VHPEPIKVCYTTVRDLVPKLWDGTGDEVPKIDIAVHIGMAGPKPVYQLERRAHRDGYVLKDVDGNLLGDDERAVREGKDWVWFGCPKEIDSEVDVEGVFDRWKGLSPVSSPIPLSRGVIY
jgi:pyroglutamyl-peptidase